MTTPRLLVALVVAGLACGCAGSSSKGAAPLPTSTDPDPSTQAATDPGLPGIGATRDDWNVRHTEDPDPKLAPGCCYVPVIDTADQDHSDTWATVESDSGYIYSYQRRFPRHTDLTEATAMVARQDLPPDARLVKHKLDGGCNTFVYRSRLLAGLPKPIGTPFVQVTFFAPNLGDVFLPGNVPSASVDLWPDESIPSC